MHVSIRRHDTCHKMRKCVPIDDLLTYSSHIMIMSRLKAVYSQAWLLPWLKHTYAQLDSTLPPDYTEYLDLSLVRVSLS